MPHIRVSYAGALGTVLGHVRNAWNFDGKLKGKKDAVKLLSALLIDNTSVTSVDLTNNGLGGTNTAEGIKAIAAWIRDSGSLTQVQLDTALEPAACSGPRFNMAG